MDASSGGFILLLMLAAGVFWLRMLIDCIRRDFKDKVLWILVLLFFSVLGAIIYYFSVFRKEKLKDALRELKAQEAQINREAQETQEKKMEQ